MLAHDFVISIGDRRRKRDLITCDEAEVSASEMGQKINVLNCLREGEREALFSTTLGSGQLSTYTIEHCAS